MKKLISTVGLILGFCISMFAQPGRDIVPVLSPEEIKMVPHPVADLKMKLTPGPVAPIKPFVIEKHGDTRTDNYFWLRYKEDAAVIDYLNAENAYTAENLTTRKKELIDGLFNEMVGRIKKDDSSVPYFDNGYWYYSRFEEGKEYPFICRKKESLMAPEEMLLDVPKMAEGHSYFSVGNFVVSPDNKKMAYCVDTLSRRMFLIYVKDLVSGESKFLNFDTGGGDVVWANDNKTIFFSGVEPNTLRFDKIYSLDASGDKKPKVVYEEKDETFYYIGVGKEKDGSFLTITCNSTLATEVLVLDANKPKGQFVPFAPRGTDHLYYTWHYKNKWYVLTNDKAKNFRLMETPEDKTEMANWKTVIAQRRDVLIEGIEVFDDYLVVQERSRAQIGLRIIKQADKTEHYVNFGEEAYDAGIGQNPEMNSGTLRFSYTSLTTPNSVIDYDMATRTKTLKKEEPVLGSFDRKNYITRRIFVTVSDGTEVPLTLVHRVDAKPNGETPILLYAYGSYGNSTDPTFSSTRLSLLDRGFTFAIAHVRGGQDMGRSWYDDGKLLKKKNTFTDFNDCARYLINNKMTSPDHLYAMGRSAGGLLMGAIVNMEPQLYKGVVAAVPFVDVVSTMMDATIPLTTAEWDEWGNPENAEYYAYMKSYSPYDNVEHHEYPALLVTTGLHDSQVQYWEPAKWVAKLRAVSGSTQPIYLHTNMEAGHGGASGRFERYKQTALIYAFLLDLENKGMPLRP